MSTMYFTITGTQFRHGTYLFEKGDKVRLVKDTKNEHDSEAIRVEVPGLGKIGYVANSVKTRIGESSSAGRIYDKIGETAEGEVMYILGDGIICKLLMDENDANVSDR